MFVILLIVPPAPFKNSAVDQINFTFDTLLATSVEESANDTKHGIACLLACQNHQIAMKIFETKKA